MTNISSIEKEFDKMLEKSIPREQWGIFRYELVKEFYREQLNKLIDEIPSEKETTDEGDHLEWNDHCQEIINFKNQAKK